MVNIEEEIEKIKVRVIEWRKQIQLIHDGVVALKDRHKSELAEQAKELKTIRQKLFACQAERDQIQKNFNDEIIKIQNSATLDQDTKYRATKLVVEKSNDFVETCEKLVPITNQYRELREDYVEQIQISRDAKLKTVNNLWITIWAMFILFFIFHTLLFWFIIPKWIQRERERAKKLRNNI